jgi:hypothetical protein
VSRVFLFSIINKLEPMHLFIFFLDGNRPAIEDFGPWRCGLLFFLRIVLVIVVFANILIKIGNFHHLMIQSVGCFFLLLERRKNWEPLMLLLVGSFVFFVNLVEID